MDDFQASGNATIQDLAAKSNDDFHDARDNIQKASPPRNRQICWAAQVLIDALTADVVFGLFRCPVTRLRGTVIDARLKFDYHDKLASLLVS
jgi:hypothetical protein